MSKISEYLDLLKQNGRKLSEINPASEEIALTVKDSLKALELLDGTDLVVYGGDILTINSGELNYAFTSWGSSYTYLNWSIDEFENENRSTVALRSYELAKDSILKAYEISRKMDSECLIVLVVAM